MLAGRPPFAGTLAGLMARRLTEDAPRLTTVCPGVPPMIDLLVARALATGPKIVRRAARVRQGAAGRDLGHVSVGRRPYSRRARPVGKDAVCRPREGTVRVRAHVADLARGIGGVVLIGGEPGVGKTRLAETAMHEARAARALCLTGHCYEMEGGAAPYFPFMEIFEFFTRLMPPRTFRETLGDAAPEMARVFPIIRQAFPDIPAPMEMPPEQQRQELFLEVSRVQRARQPGRANRGAGGRPALG